MRLGRPSPAQDGKAFLCQADVSKKLEDLATVDLFSSYVVCIMEQQSKEGNFFCSKKVPVHLDVVRSILCATLNNEYYRVSANRVGKVNESKRRINRSSDISSDKAVHLRFTLHSVLRGRKVCGSAFAILVELGEQTMACQVKMIATASCY